MADDVKKAAIPEDGAEAAGTVKRKPVIRKVTAAPTKFAPKNPQIGKQLKQFVPLDEDFDDDFFEDEESDPIIIPKQEPEAVEETTAKEATEE